MRFKNRLLPIPFRIMDFIMLFRHIQRNCLKLTKELLMQYLHTMSSLNCQIHKQLVHSKMLK